MIDDSMKSHRLIGMIQPKRSGELKKPDLYQVGCIGKITSFNETEDGRYLIIINGVTRFNIKEEINSEKLYRLCKVSYQDYLYDQANRDETLINKDLDKIFSDLKKLKDLHWLQPLFPKFHPMRLKFQQYLGGVVALHNHKN